MARLLSLVLMMALLGCGRTDPLRYPFDGGDEEEQDGGVDGGPVRCIPGLITLEPATPRVVFALDRSQSMSASFGAARRTRWRSLTSALAAVLPPADRTLELGALMFPAGSNSSCSVGAAALQPAVGNVSALISLMTRTPPGGATPTADGIAAAGALVLQDRAATSARAVVLATDGAPNCNPNLNPATCTCGDGRDICTVSEQCLDDVRSVARVTELLGKGVPTYVLGIQDSSAVAIETLNLLARAGGRPRVGADQAYYAVTSEAALASALTAIRNQVGACLYLSSSVPNDDREMEVLVDDVPVPPSVGGSSGWAWQRRDNGELQLLGEVCAQVLARGNAVLEVRVGCGRRDGG